MVTHSNIVGMAFVRGEIYQHFHYDTLVADGYGSRTYLEYVLCLYVYKLDKPFGKVYHTF